MAKYERAGQGSCVRSRKQENFAILTIQPFGYHVRTIIIYLYVKQEQHIQLIWIQKKINEHHITEI